MELSGTLSNTLGFPQKIFTSASNPAQSVSNQINSLSFGVSATAIGNKIRLVSNTDRLEVNEVTAGAMSRFGFSNATVNVSSTQSILDPINNALLNVSTDTKVVIEDRRIKIQTDQASISVSNSRGDPWNDIVFYWHLL